jgi:hypothetical protein
MTDFSHLDALQTGLAHERERLANAKSDFEREARSVWVKGYEKQIAHEKKFLGIDDTMSDDELLEALGV